MTKRISVRPPSTANIIIWEEPGGLCCAVRVAPYEPRWLVTGYKEIKSDDWLANRLTPARVAPAFTATSFEDLTGLVQW